METKICTKCGLEKDIDLFVTNKRCKDGHGAQCKECNAEYGKIRYYADIAASRAKSREQSKKSYHKDVEKSRGKAREYRINNPEQFRETNKRYRESHTEEVRERRRRYEKNNPDKKAKWDKTYRENHKEELAIKKKEYYLKNKERIGEYKKKWVQKNKRRLQEYKHQYYIDHIEQEKARAQKYYNDNREAVNKKMVECRKNNNQARIAHNMRTRIGNILKRHSNGGRLINLIGCDLDFYEKYIESLWDEGMNWGNYGRGKGKWSLDHIIPIEWFNLEDDIELHKAFHFSNTQPMWYPENSSKSNRYSGDFRDLINNS